MAASAGMVAQVRRWTNEPTTETYSDAQIAALIEQYPMMDERGVDPYYYDASTDPPTPVPTSGWVPTYDLHAASADIWDDKAAFTSDEFDYTVVEPVPGQMSRSQLHSQAVAQARYHRSRRAAKTGRLIVSPSTSGQADAIWIGNLPEWDYP